MKNIETHFKGFCFEDYRQFFEQCQSIQTGLDDPHKEALFKSGILDVLLILADYNPDLFIEVFDNYIEMGDPLSLSSNPLAKKLVEISGKERAYEILNKTKYHTKRVWLFGYYISLPPNEATHEQLEQLYDLYQEAKIAELPYGFDFLLAYRSIDKEVITRITEITLNKIEEEDSGSSYPLYVLFNPHTEVNKTITELFANELGLLKRAYFVVLKTDSYMDHDGRTFNRILDLEPKFVLEYISQIYEREKWPSIHDDILDYTFLWIRDDYENIMNLIAEDIYQREVSEREADQILFGNTYFETFFGLTENSLMENKKDHPEVVEHQDRFLKNLIESRHNDQTFMGFIFSVIVHFSPEKRIPFINLLLEHNKKFELFRKIPLEPNSWSWIGSAVPVHQKRAEYFESLLPLLNTVDLLQHKQYIEKKIGEIRSHIEWEKKRNFMED